MKYELGTDNGEKFLISMTKSHVHSREKRTLRNYHTHEHYEIININSNSQVVLLKSGREYICNSNSVLLSLPGEPHYIVRSFAGVKRTLINFRWEYVENLKEFCGIDVDDVFQNSAVQFSNENMKQLTDIFTAMNNEYKSDSKSQRLRLLLALLLDKLSYPDSIIEPRVGMSLGRMILEYIQTNYFEAITIKTLCDIFMTNRNKICSSIRTETGMTFSEALNTTRMEHAREMLSDTRLSVGDISEKIGYSSLRYFSDVFRKYEGLSPSEYRKSLNNTSK